MNVLTTKWITTLREHDYASEIAWATCKLTNVLDTRIRGNHMIESWIGFRRQRLPTPDAGNVGKIRSVTMGKLYV